MAALTLSVSSKFQFNTSKQQVVGASAAPLQALSITDAVKQPEQIFVQALSSNTGKITIGFSSGVTAGGAGIELVAGANTVLPSHKVSDYYVIADGSNQKLNIIYSSGAE
jgi:hypothetical protein